MSASWTALAAARAEVCRLGERAGCPVDQERRRRENVSRTSSERWLEAGPPVRLDPKRKWNVRFGCQRRASGVAGGCLDSRHFGVAQRRRRVFACVAFGDSAAHRAGRTLLAVAEGVRGDSASGRPEGEGVAGGVAASVGDASAFNWQSGGDARGLDLTDEPSALSTSQTPAVLLTMRAGKPGGGKGALLAEEQSLTLATGNGQTLFQPQPTRKSKRAQSDTDDETWLRWWGEHAERV
jgi:site-specific DNA-cytosine methylase